MKTEEKAKTIQNVATAVGAIFGAIGMFFGMFQANEAINLKNEVTNLQNSSQQTIVNVISTLGDDAQTADLAQSGDTVAVTDQLINVYNSTKDQNEELTSEAQTLQSENAALKEQVENLKSLLLNTYSMDEIDMYTCRKVNYFTLLSLSSPLKILHCICLADPILPGFLPGHLAGDDPGYQQFPRFALGYVAGDAELFFCHEVRAGGQLLAAAFEAVHKGLRRWFPVFVIHPLHFSADVRRAAMRIDIHRERHAAVTQNQGERLEVHATFQCSGRKGVSKRMERIGGETTACEQPLILPSDLGTAQGLAVRIQESRARWRCILLRLLPICQISGYAGRQGNAAPGMIRLWGRKLAAGISLGVAHIQDAIRQVDVAPMQGSQLPDAQAGCQRQPDTHPMRRPLAGFYQQDLLGRGQTRCLRLGFGRQIGKMRRVARDHSLPDCLAQCAVQHAMDAVQTARRKPLTLNLTVERFDVCRVQICNSAVAKAHQMAANDALIMVPGGGFDLVFFRFQPGVQPTAQCDRFARWHMVHAGRSFRRGGCA